MALTPLNEVHALQIQAGILGRHGGHTFEEHIAQEINALTYPRPMSDLGQGHVFIGDPAIKLLDYICRAQRESVIKRAFAISTGTLATSEEGVRWLNINGVTVKRCKSDLVITFEWNNSLSATVGVSTKQCNNKTPTNAQLYFTTAQGFTNLLIRNEIHVSSMALKALKQFCGDTGCRPMDDPAALQGRVSDPRRWFWEEIDPSGRQEWETIFQKKQNEISRLLFQKAYLDDPFTPDYLIHKAKASSTWNIAEMAIYSIEELIELSKAYGRFSKKTYSVKKGSYKDPAGVFHDAPRFGIIQMQRGGQAQHPNQLQFNLEAGYFYKIS
ncbi:MAG TPA: hypothetical protein VH413_07925 [Verrucomicrobiae bacterium]|jgi:hypothetical protein|nr:hypothetical protein [Verrucomicrobiae bacterium]